MLYESNVHCLTPFIGGFSQVTGKLVKKSIAEKFSQFAVIVDFDKLSFNINFAE